MGLELDVEEFEFAELFRRMEREGLELLHGTGRTRDEAAQAAARQLGFRPYSEHFADRCRLDAWQVARFRRGGLSYRGRLFRLPASHRRMQYVPD
ncbi:MAG: hypothetical protein WA813_18285 [Beijerinckiaceae bacterium]